MGIKVKISCINSIEEALAVASEKPDIIEIIVDTKPGIDMRSKSKKEAKEILENLAGIVETSVLTDKTKADELLGLIDGLTFTYLSPITTPEISALEKIKRVFPHIKIVPSIYVVDKASLSGVGLLNLNPHVDIIHLDSKVKNKLGGTGQVHDWSISQKIVQLSKKPVILSGGLKPENVRKAIQVVKPWGVDVYSGVLDEERQLDLAKVKEFIYNARH